MVSLAKLLGNCETNDLQGLNAYESFYCLAISWFAFWFFLLMYWIKREHLFYVLNHRGFDQRNSKISNDRCGIAADLFSFILRQLEIFYSYGFRYDYEE